MGSSELQNNYWESNVRNLYKSFEKDYNFQGDIVWKKLFCNYSNELKNVSKIAYKTLNKYEGKENAFKMLSPYLECFSKPNSNRIGQYCLATYYDYERDRKKAFEYFKLSAHQGFKRGQTGLANYYRFGYGTEKNEELAIKYFQLAIAQDDRYAKFHLSEMCYELANRCSRKDPEKSFKYYKLVADLKGSYQHEAEVIVAHFYKKGDGVTINLEEAIKYFKLAADAGEPHAQVELASYYKEGIFFEKNLEKAFQYWKVVAENHHFYDVQVELANCYENGIGTAVDLVEAFKYYKKIARKGGTREQFVVANWYYNGVGVAKNLLKALKWYKIVANRQNEFQTEALHYISLINTMGIELGTNSDDSSNDN